MDKSMNRSDRHSTRKTAGIRSLDDNFEWPPAFGTMSIPPRKITASVSLKNVCQNQGKYQESITDRETSRQTNKSTEIPRAKTDVSSETSSVKSSRHSKAQSTILRQKKHAIEVEKLKQKIEMKRLVNQLKLLEMENDVTEIEIDEQHETQSIQTHRNLPNEDAKSNYDVLQWVNDIPGHSVHHHVADISNPDVNTENKTEIRQLCETISEAIKSVALPRQDKFIARQVVEKDFIYFDGNPEDWQTFNTQFKRISSLCEYSAEEKMIRLQKCLRGEAKNAVSGMMASSDNIDLVLRTLEMRFGRPDQIIDGLLSKIRCIIPIRESNMDLLIQFANNVSCLVATVKSLNYEEHLQNPQLLRDLIQKLPDSMKMQWGEKLMLKNGRANLEDFSSWVNDKATAACYVTQSKTTKFETKGKQTSVSCSKRHETTLISTDSTVIDEICKYCLSSGHKIFNCTKMKADDVNTRWEVVTKQKLCFSCLRQNHQTQKCRVKKPCGISGCRRPHHRILHKNPQQEDSKRPTEDKDQATQTIENENVLAVGQGARNILLRMVKVKLYGNDTVLETVALCDEGSTVTLIDKSFAERLRLQGETSPLCIQWTNDLISRHQDSSMLNLQISGAYVGARMFAIRNVRTVENLSLPLQIIEKSDWEKYTHLQGIPFNEINERPMILLGQDNIRLTVARKAVQTEETSPMATKTNLGWILHGNVDKNHSPTYSFHMCHSELSDEALHQLVKCSFTTDAFGTSPPQTKLNKAHSRARDIMMKTTKRVGDRFETGLLWKEDDMTFPESKTTAIQRLKCVERQMQKNSIFKAQYCDKIASYIEKGYARKLTPDEANQDHPRCWYLPHFGVINPNKPDKLRLVFDAASKSHGISLNQNLLAGPDLLQSLIEVLLKFRLRKIAFCSDVREMFHQVRIIKEDQHSQRFLWRNGDIDKDFDTYEMQVMTFGATCSPTCAQFVKNLNAEQMTDRKEILEAIIKKHYVDDYLDCTDTIEEALDIITEVRRIQRLGGFELVNWISNSREVMNSLSKDDLFCKDLNSTYETTLQRILGLAWNAKTDVFCYKLKNIEDNLDETFIARPTKRQILKDVMSVFDPLGLIVNFTIRGRMIVQDIWRTGIGWDDSITEDLNRLWQTWRKDLKNIESLTIPRCYSWKIPEADTIELHIFCDGSSKAFAAVAYLRVKHIDDVDLAFILARARVAPTKPISIPRLELQAAVMGSRLADTIRNTLNIKIDRTCMWSDSTTVLHWIRGDASKLGQFEAHRIGEIQEITNTNDWRWVPSKLNAADNATRTYDKQEFIDFESWFRGPVFLYDKNEDSWPKSSIFSEKLEDAEIMTLITETPPQLLDAQRFSKWSRLLRTTAWIFRFVKIMINRLRNGQDIIPAELTAMEIEQSRILLIKQCQSESFKEEIDCIKNNKPLKGHSRLKNLSPILDDHGLLVLSGRIDNAPDIELFTKRPMIISKESRITRLLLQYFHEKFAHQGVETVLNAVRQTYWVLDGRCAVKSTFAICQRCKVKKAKPVTPLMGQLPTNRLTSNVRPFTYTGIDYFGPLYVSVGRRREKRWGVLFTCLTIRAVHLEVAHSLTTESTIMAVRRMISRRGQPKEILSDNGTNMRGAAEELKRAVQEIDRNKMINSFTENGMEWKFLPPASPHMAGAWERLVRSVKTTFNSILKGQVLKDELLLTLFAECEYIVNSRPLTKVSTDPNDLDALTPNHLLIRSSTGISEFRDLQQNYRNEWRKSLSFIDAFWKRWTKEYLPTLTKRTKWTNDGKPLEIDEIVIIIEDNVPRRSWKLGKVMAVYPGPDGRVRVVDVKTSTGVYKRPVARLCRVNVEDQS